MTTEINLPDTSFIFKMAPKFCEIVALANLSSKLMTRAIFLTLFLVWAMTGQAQIIDLRVEKYIAQNCIDTLIVYSYPCSGCIRSDSCHYEEPHYLIWQHNGGVFLKRFDYCKTYRALPLDSSNPLAFYLKNKRIIDKEQIRPPTYYELRKNKQETDTLTVTSTVDHSSYHDFEFVLKEKKSHKYADIYDLDFKTFDNGRKNIYYTYNQKTRFKALIDLTTALLKEFDDTNKFEGE